MSFTSSCIVFEITEKVHDMAANVLDYDKVVSGFEQQSHYCAHFLSNSLGKGMAILISKAVS